MTPRELARFQSKIIIEPNSYCWLWEGTLRNNGYAEFAMRTGHVRRRCGWQIVYAHRVAYQHFVGPIPEGMFVCHKCDVRACVNPEHLFVGTHADNMRDMCAKGRAGHHTAPDKKARGTTNGSAKLTDSDVREIRRRRAAGQSLRSIGRAFGVSHKTVGLIVTGRAWKHVDARIGATEAA